MNQKLYCSEKQSCIKLFEIAAYIQYMSGLVMQQARALKLKTLLQITDIC